MISEWTDTHRMGICHDCQEMPENRHFTTVPSLNHRDLEQKFGPYAREMFNDAVCDCCFLRRRLEGKL